MNPSHEDPRIRILSTETIEPLALEPPLNSEMYDCGIAPWSTRNIQGGVLQVYLMSAAYTEMQEHVRTDTTVELGGLMVGEFGEWGRSRFIVVERIIPQPKAMFSAPGLIRFMNEFWSMASERIDEWEENESPLFGQRFLRLGCYHSHPGFGVFVSSTDKRAIRGVFSEPWHAAIIVDPINEDAGAFLWDGQRVTERLGFFVCEQRETTDRAESPDIGREGAFDRVEPGDTDGADSAAAGAVPVPADRVGDQGSLAAQSNAGGGPPSDDDEARDGDRRRGEEGPVEPEPSEDEDDRD